MRKTPKQLVEIPAKKGGKNMVKNRAKTQVEVFTEDLAEAIEIAEAELGENFAEIEEYFTFFEGEEKKDRFVFVTPEHKLFPESSK